MQIKKNHGDYSTILTLNSGSSSLKAALFKVDGTRRDFHYNNIGASGMVDHAAAFDALLAELDEVPQAVGHRVVFGGPIDDELRMLDQGEIDRLTSLIRLAPLHLPGNLRGIHACRQGFDIPQFACFDTAFHRHLPDISQRLPIPSRFGMKRYGFHGLSYAWIAQQLPQMLGQGAGGHIVVAHLGSGSSLCLFEELRSIDTTMGFTPLGGVTMATRSGDIDPGVVLELCRQQGIEPSADLLAHECGLLSLSNGESSDMEALLNSCTDESRFAVDYYCHQIRASIGAMAANAGGVDALVFTGGIGENADQIRDRICRPLAFLGFHLDASNNLKNEKILHGIGSKPILCLPADEESMIRNLIIKHGRPTYN